MNSYVELFGLTLLHFLWQGCVLGGAFLVAMLFARRADARVRYAICCVTLLAMVLCPVGTAVVLRPTVVEFESPQLAHVARSPVSSQLQQASLPAAIAR